MPSHRDTNKKMSFISILSFSLDHNHQRVQYLAGILATLTMFISGNFIGWTSPTLPKLTEGNGPVHLTNAQGSWMASLLNLGSVPGAILAGIFADTIGRKNTLLAAAPFFLGGWILIFFARSVGVLYVGRFTAGFGLAVGSAVCSLYIGEIAEKNIRGRLCGLVMFMNNFGVVFALCVGPYVSYNNFIIILSVFPFLFVMTFCWMPESPFYRLKQNNRDAAMQSMLVLRGIDDQKCLNKELDTMQTAVEDEMQNKSTLWTLISEPVYRRSLIIILGVKTMQHFSGVAAIQSYMQTIFDETDSFIPSSIAGILCGLMQMAAGLFSSGFVDRFGRKPLLLFSAVGCAISLFGVGLYFFLQDYEEADVTSISWLPLASIMMFMAVQPIGVGNLSYVLLGELFPTNVKGIAAIAATVYGSTCAFTVTKLFEVISTSFGRYVTFWLCMTFILLGIVFTICYIPETKGKTLLQIQVDFSKHKSNKKEQMITVVT